MTKEKHISEPRINDRIRVPEVRLVGPNGEQVGIVRVEDALRLAAEADLDLVEVAPMAKPPVAKLMDFGKYKYEAAMKAREARKNQVNTVIKEIKLRPKIDPHDYGTKKGHVERFLKGGDKVKVTIMFRGREQSRPELGFRLLQRLAEDVLELGTVESAPKQDGRNMVMVIAPTKKKAQAMAEQRRRRDESGAGGHADERPRRSTLDRTTRRRPRARGRPRPQSETTRPPRPGGRRGAADADRVPRPRRPTPPRATDRLTRRPPHASTTEHTRRSAPCRRTRRTAAPRSASGSPARARSCASRPATSTSSTRRRPQKARALSKDILVSKGDLKKVKKLLGR